MLSGFIFDSSSETDCNFPSDPARRMDWSRWDTCALRILHRVVRSELHARPRNLVDPPCGSRSIPARVDRLDRRAPMGFGPASRIALSYHPRSSARGFSYGHPRSTVTASSSSLEDLGNENSVGRHSANQHQGLVYRGLQFGHNEWHRSPISKFSCNTTLPPKTRRSRRTTHPSTGQIGTGHPLTPNLGPR